MEGDQENKFVCKFCSKTFRNRKSLGGHMRCHLALISAEKHEDHIDTSTGFEGNDHKKVSTTSDTKNGNLDQEKLKNTQMGLREKLKKSWRISDPKHFSSKNENLCKECGKGFHNLRALYGHMRCHSIKEKEREENICEKCGKSFESVRALFGHMSSHSKRSRLSNESMDYETACPIRSKRSRMRYKIDTNSSISNLTVSPSVSEIQEVEEVARCLMMLSRGVNTNSAIFEVQSLNLSKGIIENDGEKGVCDVDETWKVRKPIVASVDDFVRNDEFKKVELVASDYGFDQADSELIKSSSRQELGVKSCEEIKNTFDSKFLKDSRKKSEYKCRTCNKIFHSFRALGGHQSIHKRTKNNFLFNAEIKSRLGKFKFNGDSLDQEESEVGVRYSELKTKIVHECSICFKVFPSGQALGGHKRAHYGGLCENKAKESIFIEQEFPDIHNVLDVNHPLDLNREVSDDEDDGFSLWWDGLRRDREPELRLISN